MCEVGLIGLPEKAEGSPEPLDSKWMASGGGKVTRDFLFLTLENPRPPVSRRYVRVTMGTPQFALLPVGRSGRGVISRIGVGFTLTHAPGVVDE